MKKNVLRVLVFGCLALGLRPALAESLKPEELVSGRCSVMSKDPRCWESRPYCQNTQSCSVIEGVFQNSEGKFYCEGLRGEQFSCDALVKQEGVHLGGLSVEVETFYADLCKIPGGCGGKACLPLGSTARLNPTCGL